MRPASYRGLRKSHKNMLEWPKIAFPPPKNRTTLRENTSTLLEATGTARIAPGGAALAPAARCSPGPEYSAKNEMLSCIKTRFELLPSLTSLGSWARMIFWEEIPHLGGKGWGSYKRVSLPDEKKEAVVWTEWRKAFPGSLSFVRSYLKELIPTSPFTERPSSCSRQKHEDHLNTTSPSAKVQHSMQHRWNVSNLNITFWFFYFFFYFFFSNFFLKIIYFSFTPEEASLQQHLRSSRSRGKTWRQTKPLPSGTNLLLPGWGHIASMRGGQDGPCRKLGFSTDHSLKFGKSPMLPASVFQSEQYEHYCLPLFVKGSVICTVHTHWDIPDINFCFISDYVIVINLPAFSTEGSDPSQSSRWSSADFT